MKETARRALSALGVPQDRQDAESLMALLPPGLTAHASLDSDVLADLLVDYIRQGLIDLPHASAEALSASLRPGAHDLLLYRGMSELLELAIPFLKAGLERDEVCVWVLPEGFSADAALRALSWAVSDLEPRIARGQLELVRREDCYTGPSGSIRAAEDVVDGFLAKESDALIRGFRGLRATGDFFWAKPGDFAELMRYERLCHAAIPGRRITGLCTYPLETLPRDRAAQLLACHREAVYKMEPWWHSSPAGDPAKLKAVLALRASAPL